MAVAGIPGMIGRLAEGDAFFDRKEIMTRAWDLLKTNNLLLLAPRRVGKSSLLNRMRIDGPSMGFKTIYLAVPDAEDELDFIRRLVRSFRQAEWSSGSWISVFRDHLPEDLEFVLKTGLVELKAKKFDWRRPADELETLLKNADSETLLLIDELPLLIASINRQDPSGARAERFLLWLKRIREQFQPRWFLAGSIGLDSIARALRLSGTIHDLHLIELGPFSPEVARQYLTLRARHHGWILPPETIESILHATEWLIPFHLNLVFEELRVAAIEESCPASPEMVERAFKRLLAHGRTHFDHWDERLGKILDSRLRSLCEVILGLACRSAAGVAITGIELRLTQEVPDGTERAVLIRQLLDLMTSDGYLVRIDERVRFRSSLLRRYWLEVL